MPLATGKITEGADDTCFGGMGAGRAADDRREKVEALIRFWCGSVWLAVDKVKLVVACCGGTTVAGISVPTTPADMAAGTDGAGRWKIPASA